MEKDHLAILLKDIRGKFDLVLEGHDVLRKEIRDTREELCEKVRTQILNLVKEYHTRRVSINRKP